MSNSIAGLGMTSDRTRMRMVARLRAAGIADERVLTAMAAVPRHLFIDEALASRAYDDVALPIGFGQTISQPYTVARVAELARGGRDPDKVLEVGSGSGYQAAVLAHLCRALFAIERIDGLLRRARTVVTRELRLPNVRFRHADGFAGLPEEAPFDAIVVSAAVTAVPEALLLQLAEGGCMVYPKQAGRGQQLCVIGREARSSYVERAVGPVKFVPALAGKVR
jgi:protein-L-isoaspartate(D-aspartate) O-methyltransferase